MAEPIWNCHHCLFDNTSEALKCEICANPKESVPFTQWLCAECNYENFPDSIKCITCGNKRT